MVKGELSIALYWVMVAVILGIYLWTIRTVDIGFYIILLILVLLGIGYSVVHTTTYPSEFLSRKELAEIENRINKLEESVNNLSKTIEELKKLLEE